MGFWNLLASKWNRNNRPKTIGGRPSKPRRNVLALEFLEDRTTPTSFVNFVDPSPSAGNGFGTVILPLISGGNVVVTAPFDDSAFTDAGAVYLYNGSTGALISTLKGSSANNNIGSGGVTALTNGNFVISSPNWDSATANVGAVTWGSSSTGVVGSVSSTNSLVGTTVTDQVGSAGVVALSNGHYAVASPLWNGAAADTGAATWGNGSSGTFGAVSSTNSLVGTTASDQVGSGGLKALTGNGNFVVASPGWDNIDNDAPDAGAVTWVAGATAGTAGRSGAVTTSNSMAGGGNAFAVGSGGVTVLTNGNYVTSSPEWGSGNGAATWGNGTAATTGIVDLVTNSIGGSITDRVSSGGVVALNNGSFVIKSPAWSGTFGAATWGSGTAALLGNISTTNSLVGSTAGDAVGTSVVALTGATGNYVVVTSLWDNGATANVGAVTWGSRTTGVVGTVGTGNSIVGSTANDNVGSGGAIALSNGHYVISSPNWDSTTLNVGAATWASGTALTSATVASGNSTIGSTLTDNVSSGGIAALSNGNYVIASPNWDNGATANVGAATWASGTAATSATVATGNSYVGSTASDQVASGGVKALTGNGNYVIVSPNWDNSSTANVGAVTWVNGAATANGTVGTGNSVYGDTATDQVGSAGVTALASGNYLVSSPLWDNGATANAGATTSLRGGVATAGAVSANYSITGSTASGGLLTPVVDTTNNNFYTRFTAGATGQAGGLILAGSITPTAPLITSAATTTITYGNSLTFTVIATGDPDNNDPAPLVFSATGIPAGVTLNSSSGVLTGTPRAGTHNLVITASNKVASSATQNFSLIVNQRVLTVTGTTANNKIYNGNTTAVLNTGSSALANTVSGDSIGLDVSAATGTFPAKTIGTGLLVTIAGMTLTGTDSANYLLTQPTTTANITAKGLTVSGTTAANKVYDGNTTATMNQTSSVLVGIVSGDTVTLGGTATGTFPAKTIGTSLLVTIAGFTTGGADAGNYTLTQPTTTADITALGLTVSGTTAANKVYDGNTTSTLSTGSSALVGIVSGDTVTLGGTAVGTFASANIGSGITVSIAGFTIAGTDSGNYTLSQPSTTANITALALTVSGTTASNKVYDGNNTATMNQTLSALVGIVSGDTVTLGGTATGTFPSKTIGSSLLVTIAGFTISGSSNYTLTQPTTTADITALGLTVSGTTAANKVYDGGTTSTVSTGSSALVGVLSGDTVTLGGTAVGTFASANIATGITVSIAGFTISGTDAGNYTLSQPSTTASITAKGLTVSGTTAANKVYDGGTTSTLSTGSSALVGVVSGDTVTLGGTAVGTFASANAATGITVSIAGFSISGSSSGNYTLTQPTTTANITALALTVSGTTASNKAYDGNTTSTVSTGSSVLVGVLSGDTVTLGGTAVGTFASANAATGITVSIAGFTISGSSNYTLTQPTTTANITKVNQSISWSTPTAITLGLPLSSTQLSALASGVSGGSAAGNLTYDSPLGTVLSSGTYTLGVTAASTTNYNQATGSVSITVNPYFTDPSPSLGNGFGTVIVTLPGGNLVITAPYDDFAATDAGAVYLYSGTTGALISTLRGGRANDQIGVTGVTALSNGNYVIRSATWDNGAATDAGAVTFGNATTGVSGSVSSQNSLVGSSSSDNVGSYAILALANGNYVVNSPDWNKGSVVDAGAVTFGAGDSGVSGAISSVNSLVGSNTTDKVGSSGVTALANGNYVVRSQLWGTSDVGAVTWGSGTSGITGAVSSTNSIIGSTANDFVGNTAITALTGGNFVLVSPNWDNGSGNSAGAATWLDGTTGKTILGAFGTLSATNSLVGSSSRNGDSVGANGVTSLTNGNFVVISASWNGIRGAATWGSANAGVVGQVSSSNSMIGDVVGANVGSGGVTALTGGNYVINSYNWNSNKGAVTFGIGSTGTSGTVANANSLVGSVNNSYVGLDGMSQLANNNYVVKSSLWNNGSVAVGAATFASGSSGVSGTVSSGNSLVGSSAGDKVGAKITTLTNNNYVVVSSSWTRTGAGAATSVGAITWGSGSSGVSGLVSSTNSLIGSALNDQIGSGGITVLSNNNYIVSSPLWNNGSTADTGAVTWGNGGSGSTGALSTSNSLVGSNTTDKIGSGGITALGANYVVVSPLWNNSSVVDAGSVTWGNGSGQVTTGAVTSSNSFVGSTTNDKVGSGGITVLSNNNFVVSSPLWNNGAATTAGAVTWGSGASGSVGTIGSTNSLVGSTKGDQLGSGGIKALTGNGNYTIASPLWNNGGTSDVGAVTFGNGDGSTKGTVASGNSLIGSTAFDQVGSGGVTALSSGNYLVSSANWKNGSLANAGAVTWGRGTIEGGVGGVSGAVSTSNSTVGSVANANLQFITLNGTGGTYLVSFLSDGSGPRVNYGFQNPTNPVFTNASSTTFTIGVSKSFTFSATGSPTPAFSLISVTGAGTSLPSGLSLNNSTGVLSGTAASATAGTYTLTVRATNGLGVNVNQIFTLTVS